MTYRRLAQIAGVSEATVSKALSYRPEVNEETAKRIRALAEQYGVVRATYRRERSKTRFAVLVPEIVSVYYSSDVTGLVSRLHERGIETAIYLCGFGVEHAAEQVEMICSERLADGIFMFGDFTKQANSTLPLISLCNMNAPVSCEKVSSDISSGIFMALEYLKTLGHTRIGFLGERNTPYKLRWFRSAMTGLGLPLREDLLFISSARFEQVGYDGAAYCMKLSELPTALICAYDEVALGAVKYFQDHGVKIPDDLSVVGINDIPNSSYAGIPLTTIRPDSEDMIEKAIERMLLRVEGKSKPTESSYMAHCELIIRATTAKPRTACGKTVDPEITK